MAKDKKKAPKTETGKSDVKSAKDKAAAKPIKPEKKKTSPKTPSKKSAKSAAKQSPPPAEEASHVTSDHIVALRRRLNYEIFLKCLEKKYLSDEEELEEDSRE